MTARRAFATAWIGGHPIQFALAADGTRMYVVYRDAVAVLCLITNEIVDTIAVDAQPSCVATSPDGTRLYVADYSGRITVFEVTAQTSFDDVLDVETGIAVGGARARAGRGLSSVADQPAQVLPAEHVVVALVHVFERVLTGDQLVDKPQKLGDGQNRLVIITWLA